MNHFALSFRLEIYSQICEMTEERKIYGPET